MTVPASVLPPLDMPRRPAHAVPPGATDCHVHVFAPSDRIPFSPDRAYTPAPGIDPARLIRMHETIGISRAVLVASNVYAEDLRATEDALAAHPDRFRGVALIRPDIADSELDRLHRLGFRAVRINLVLPGALRLEDLPVLAPRLSDRGWHLEVQAKPETLAEVVGQFLALPLDIAIDHLALIRPEHGENHPGIAAVLRLLDGGRGWAKLSGPYVGEPGGPRFPRAAALARRFAAAAPERCLWGSNFPHPQAVPMPDDGDLIDWLAEAVPGAAARKRILVDNPARLFGFRSS
ncbi:MAG: GntR family transcriptional regulator [Alphaproteobacteria bacterium]|nr:GntR family transcriptional regulator [Alphaproteobacteria bacterium]